MTDTPTAAAVVVTASAAARTTWKDLIPLLAIILTVAGIIYAAGQLHSRLGETERAVVELKNRADRNDDRFVELVGKVERVDGRVERVDGKLDLLIDRTPARP